MLEGNRSRVQRLTGGELWLFILTRVLIGFGVGVLAMINYPTVVAHLAWPAIVVGLVMFLVASRGLFREPTEPAA